MVKNVAKSKCDLESKDNQVKVVLSKALVEPAGPVAQELTGKIQPQFKYSYYLIQKQTKPVDPNQFSNKIPNQYVIPVPTEEWKNVPEEQKMVFLFLKTFLIYKSPRII